MINAKTVLTGIIGYPLSHTLSPLMHNTAFRKNELNYIYLPFEVKDEYLPEVLTSLKTLNVKGVNVTIPYKESFLDRLDGISHEAKRIGAINTIVNEGGYLWGYNTDCLGFYQSLAPYEAQLKNKKALILGFGGAAKAIIVALEMAGVQEVIIATRKKEKITIDESIYDLKITILEYEDLNPDLIGAMQLIVNTTPLGMYPNLGEVPPLDIEHIHKEQIIYDIIYNPVKTRFLLKAEEKGCNNLNGVDMLVYQGARAFELWTKTEAPVNTMKDAVIKYLNDTK